MSLANDGHTLIHRVLVYDVLKPWLPLLSRLHNSESDKHVSVFVFLASHEVTSQRKSVRYTWKGFS